MKLVPPDWLPKLVGQTLHDLCSALFILNTLKHHNELVSSKLGRSLMFPDCRSKTPGELSRVADMAMYGTKPASKQMSCAGGQCASLNPTNCDPNGEW
jgi:hypothetical protein